MQWFPIAFKQRFNSSVELTKCLITHVFSFLTTAPWQIATPLHQTASSSWDSPYFFHASLTWNILMLQSKRFFLPFHLTALFLTLVLQITPQTSLELLKKPVLTPSPLFPQYPGDLHQWAYPTTFSDLLRLLCETGILKVRSLICEY